jgi:hypothetical protein
MKWEADCEGAVGNDLEWDIYFKVQTQYSPAEIEENHKQSVRIAYSLINQDFNWI